MASFEYTITEPMGLHARPAGLLVKQLKNYTSSVEISCRERKADAKKPQTENRPAAKSCLP